MQLSQEFVQAQLEEHRRSTERCRLVRMAAASRRRQPRIGGFGTFGGLPGSLRQAIRQGTAWLRVSQLGPSASPGRLPEADWSERRP